MTIDLNMVENDNLFIKCFEIFGFIFCKISPLSARYIVSDSHYIIIDDERGTIMKKMKVMNGNV